MLLSAEVHPQTNKHDMVYSRRSNRARRRRINPQQPAFIDADLDSPLSEEFDALHPSILERFRVPDSLHPWQAHAIDKILGGHDIMISAGTGSGKSLVFQSLALAKPDAVVLVIAPLNALMETQVHPEPVDVS
jgi:superfamily II DNA helicase RecQ